MVAAARALGPAIRDASDEIESTRRLPGVLTDKLTAADIFQMYLPASVGGAQVDPLVAFAVCEELTRHDGSLGWCVQVAASTSTSVSWIDPVGLEEMASGSEKIHTAGSARPLGEATPVEGGFVVSGHWNYASGVLHANWFLATSFVDPPGSTPRKTRPFLVPVSSGQIVENWDVVGMRGTGSNDFVLDEVFVPDTRVGYLRFIRARTEMLYDDRLAMSAAWAPIAGVAVGLARGAIDSVVKLGGSGSTNSPAPLRDRTTVQDALARAEAITRSARAFVVESLEQLWESLRTDSRLDIAVADANLAITHAMNEAVTAVDIVFHAAGTNAISSANRVERFLRDTHTAVQHAAGQRIHQRAAGRALLGLDPVPASVMGTVPAPGR
jgi:alkylation response protein AidB-like acyl-CoA dehydrogenase